ncbi:MAG: type II toxin-antitoxin system RelE/ParE family toxin [Pontimonas sp.]|nr:type II toxin-antitoxin system RelE/ParE family toxin [Pontimonas sp.]
MVIEKKASRALLALDKNHRARITGAIELLARNPHPPAARKLTNRLAYRVRVGDYRIIYSVNDTTITIMVLATGHRRDVYR